MARNASSANHQAQTYIPHQRFPPQRRTTERLQFEPARYTALVAVQFSDPTQRLLVTSYRSLSVNDRQPKTMSCPAPFLSAADYPYTGGFIDGRICGNPTPDLQCCLACDKSNWVYTNSKPSSSNNPPTPLKTNRSNQSNRNADLHFFSLQHSSAASESPPGYTSPP